MTNRFTLNDLEELSNIFATQYNNEKIHDRVLVFDVVKDEWNKTCVVNKTYCTNSAEPNYEVKSTTSDEKSDQKSSPSAASECVLNQNEEYIPPFPELTNLPHRKRPSDEGNKPLSKRPREDLSVESESETKLDKESIVIGIPFIEDDGPEEEAVAMDDKLQPSSQTSTNLSDSQVLRQHNIFVHTTWLAVHSEYFHSLFYSGMKESTTREVHMKVPESEEKGHLLMLEAVYRPYILDTASVDELLLVLELADKYSVRFVFRKCKYVLQAMELSIEICEKIIHVIRVKHNMAYVSDVANTVQKFLAKEFSPLDKNWETEKFRDLSEPLLKSLLGSSDLTTQAENTVFHALMDWINSNNYDISNSNLPSLLTVVRFELLSIDYLYNVVHNHPIATNMAHFTDLYLKGITHHALPEGIRTLHRVKPVNRQEVESGMVQYTWIIQKDQLETLKDGKTHIGSEMFWWCGYAMRLCLKKKLTPSIEFPHGFPAYIRLEAHSMRLKSELKVSWSCKSEHFHKSSFGIKTFVKKQRMAVQDVIITNAVQYANYTFPQSISINVSIEHSS